MCAFLNFTEKEEYTSKMFAELYSQFNNFQRLPYSPDFFLLNVFNFYAPGTSTPKLFIRIEMADNLTYVS